jgi:hypothetical protein
MFVAWIMKEYPWAEVLKPSGNGTLRYDNERALWRKKRMSDSPNDSVACWRFPVERSVEGDEGIPAKVIGNPETLVTVGFE